MSQYKRGRPNGPTVLPSLPELGRAADDRSPWPQGTQVAYQRNRLARWAEKRSAWAYGAPGRCPGLGEPRAFGPGTYRVSRKKTGTLPTHSDPRILGRFCAGQSHPTRWVEWIRRLSLRACEKWGLAPPPYAYDRENHANARRLSPLVHKLSAKERPCRGAIVTFVGFRSAKVPFLRGAKDGACLFARSERRPSFAAGELSPHTHRNLPILPECPGRWDFFIVVRLGPNYIGLGLFAIDNKQ